LNNFARYIDQFRNGSFILNAHFYKAECHHRINEYREALESYNFITGMFRNTFTEQALLGASSINYELGNYKDALINYEELETGGRAWHQPADCQKGSDEMQCASGKSKGTIKLCHKGSFNRKSAGDLNVRHIFCHGKSI
jgi:tetratricopeptide (TPR) repeat protein